MRTKIVFQSLLVLFFLVGIVGQSNAQWWFEMEAGLPFVGYNKVRIPNNATPFDFQKDFTLQGIVIPVRLRAAYTFKEKNQIIALAAPLSVTYTGMSPKDIDFQQVTFPEGSQIDGLYKFNSFRLTYRRQLIKRDQWWFSLGFTAKIRDARVRLRSNEISASKNDIGFVPLLHVYSGYDFGKFKAIIEADGLAGGPGRAFDVFAGVGYSFHPSWEVRLGYRLLEGGADVDEVFNFTLIQFMSMSVNYSLN